MHDNIRNTCLRVLSLPKTFCCTENGGRFREKVTKQHTLLLWHTNCKIHIQIRLPLTTLSTDPTTPRMTYINLILDSDIVAISYSPPTEQWTYVSSKIFFFCVWQHFVELCQPVFRSCKPFDDAAAEFWDELLLRLFPVYNTERALSQSECI